MGRRTCSAAMPDVTTVCNGCSRGPWAIRFISNINFAVQLLLWVSSTYLLTTLMCTTSNSPVQVQGVKIKDTETRAIKLIFAPNIDVREYFSQCSEYFSARGSSKNMCVPVHLSSISSSRGGPVQQPGYCIKMPKFLY